MLAQRHCGRVDLFKPVSFDGQLREAPQQLKVTATPLLAPLTADERTAAGTEESSSTHNRC
jgi:hypothetical protein